MQRKIWFNIKSSDQFRLYLLFIICIFYLKFLYFGVSGGGVLKFVFKCGELFGGCVFEFMKFIILNKIKNK